MRDFKPLKAWGEIDSILLFSINLKENVAFILKWSDFLKRLDDESFRHNKSNSQIFQMWQALKSIFVNGVKRIGCKQSRKSRNKQNKFKWLQSVHRWTLSNISFVREKKTITTKHKYFYMRLVFSPDTSLHVYITISFITMKTK